MAEEIRREAVSEARRYVGERRREADREARCVIADAHTRARAIHIEADAAARAIVAAGLKREEIVLAGVRALEQRLDGAFEGLRGITRELETLLVDASPRAPATMILEPRPIDKPLVDRPFGVYESLSIRDDRGDRSTTLNDRPDEAQSNAGSAH